RVPVPSGVKRTSTSVRNSAPNCHCAVICQASTSLRGGSHVSTVPHRHSEPSSPRSYQRPPFRGSIITSLSGDRVGLIENAGFHHLPIFAVNAANASCCDACTSTDRRMGCAELVVIDVSFSAWS